MLHSLEMRQSYSQTNFRKMPNDARADMWIPPHFQALSTPAPRSGVSRQTTPGLSRQPPDGGKRALGIVENALMNKKTIFIFLTVCAILLLPVCSSPEVYASEPLSESTIFVAEGINNFKIQFIWLEIPTTIKSGKEEVRLFLAKTDPPEPTIPNPNELRCLLSSENETAILGPERIPFEFKEDGTFSGSYTYKACPECIECYMNWDYTLEITGAILEERIVLEIAIKHFGHNVQGSYMNAKLEQVSNGNKEPRISCNRMIECQEIVFVNR